MPCADDDARCDCGGRWSSRPVGTAEALDVLPRLDLAMASTDVSAVRIDQAALYADVQETGTALRAPAGHISLRVDPYLLPGGSTMATRPDGQRALLLGTGRDRPPRHRVGIRADASAAILDDLPGATAAVRGVVGDPRIPWQEADQIAQLDTLVRGGSFERRRALGEVYPEQAASVDLRCLPEILLHLCGIGLPLSVAVVGEGIAHLTTGRIALVEERVPGQVETVLDNAMVGIGTDRLREMLLVVSHGPCGPTPSLELYDPRGEVVLVLTQIGAVGAARHSAWADMAHSLPPARG